MKETRRSSAFPLCKTSKHDTPIFFFIVSFKLRFQLYVGISFQEYAKKENILLLFSVAINERTAKNFTKAYIS